MSAVREVHERGPVKNLHKQGHVLFLLKGITEQLLNPKPAAIVSPSGPNVILVVTDNNSHSICSDGVTIKSYYIKSI